MIYLDNSATTYPKPQGVRQAVQRAFTDSGANPGRSGYGMCLRTTQAVYQVLYQGADPRATLDGLFSRSLKQEF